MTKKDQDTDIKFIQALAEVLKVNDLAEIRVKREYDADNKLDIRVTRAYAPAAAATMMASPSTSIAPTTNNIEASKITSTWFLWMHHTVDKIPERGEKKYLWQKNHKENKTGSKDSYKPVKIKKENKLKKYETWK